MIGPNAGVNQNDLQIIKVNLRLLANYSEAFGTSFEFLRQHGWVTFSWPTAPDNHITVEEEMTCKFQNHSCKMLVQISRLLAKVGGPTLGASDSDISEPTSGVSALQQNTLREHLVREVVILRRGTLVLHWNLRYANEMGRFA